ncbi:outer membrane protein assembly factor BamE [Pseudomonas putida]|uniref:outer membrane protein assembly factor BamE n=1 Tax=Pseudomonas putida TaxID=303 RepID=UPI002363F9CC|nr:outer membrane protein assembly factor BamE [Pseudomonas putida]MDD2139856.1 outer membrane protein assembly factor BamE [Pseudomonas putida]HDS1721779.1 outer membrane protein assembly factor BamE [Pseudomonas putida]
MKKVAFLAAAALTVSMLGGCANGRSPLDYETGTFVTPEKVQELKASKATQQQVVAAIGYPSSKSELSGKELWRYDYNLITAIPFVGQNKAEATVFEWNRGGKLLDAYKTNGGNGSSSNALLKAAGM